jgi:L-asparaginase
MTQRLTSLVLSIGKISNQDLNIFEEKLKSNFEKVPFSFGYSFKKNQIDFKVWQKKGSMVEKSEENPTIFQSFMSEIEKSRFLKVGNNLSTLIETVDISDSDGTKIKEYEKIIDAQTDYMNILGKTSILQSKDSKKTRILVLSTGGTMSCRPNEKNELVPSPFTIQSWLENEISEGQLVSESIIFCSLFPCIDSALASPTSWESLVNAIVTLTDYDALVVIHGTDTLAYTSSLLSLAFSSHPLPIVVTASQYPLGPKTSDATLNLLGSILCAKALSLEGFSGTYVFFNSLLLRGNRIRKSHANSHDAFEPVNCLPVGKVVGGKTSLHVSFLKSNAKNVPSTYPTLVPSKNVRLLKINPMMTLDDMKVYINSFVDKSQLYVIILEAYGTGNVPTWLKNGFLQDNSVPNIIYFACSQCYAGKTESHYEVDVSTNYCKTLSDMTPETAVVKAALLLSLGNVRHTESFSKPSVSKQVGRRQLSFWEKEIPVKSFRTNVNRDLSYWRQELQDETLKIPQSRSDPNFAKIWNTILAGSKYEGILSPGRVHEIYHAEKQWITCYEWFQIKMKESWAGEITNEGSTHSKDGFFLSNVI